VDAIYFEVRHEGSIEKSEFSLLSRIREDGLRDILGASVAESEGNGFLECSVSES